MNRAEKQQLIDQLSERLSDSSVVYLADTAELDAEQTSALREACFKQGIQLQVVKNTMLKRAFDSVEDKEFSELETVLKGSTSLMTADVGNAPAKLIKQFRKKHEKPVLKGAWIDSAVFIGDNQLETLASMKSKDELIGEIVTLLQSPMKNVISGLKGSGGDKVAGLVKALSERE